VVKRATRDETLWDKVISALKETKNISSFRHEKKDVVTGDEKQWTLQVQAFSDCVVLFIPTETRMLSWLLASIRRLHDRLLRLGVPVRGGITIGGMHWEDEWSAEEPGKTDVDTTPTPVAFGPGLVAAYDLENATAVYPRMLISSSLYDHIEEQNLKAFPLGPAPLLGYCRQDFDGLYHFDVLHPKINRQDVIAIEDDGEDGTSIRRWIRDKTSFADWMKTVRKFIYDGRDSVDGEKLEAKYLWFGHYFNEKAKDADGVSLIHWYEDLVPEG